ncbi:hypothetical protein Ancab_040643 [Ancistrocladus abbreviatus]
MARFGLSLRRRRELQLLQYIIIMINIVVLMYVMWRLRGITLFNRLQLKEEKKNRRRIRIDNLYGIITDSDRNCQNELRMNRHTFGVLCEMLRDIGGLRDTRNMSLQEIVAMFLYTLAHHKKNRSLGQFFVRSGETVSRQFNLCLKATLKLKGELLKRPTPITDGCEDERWKCFKNCLGALDGTYISVTVPSRDKPRYRTRKGSIAMNVLGVCSPDKQFIFVLPGWEGSAHDGRVLRDAISWPNGLKVPQGFLAPYRGQRYHLNEWRSGAQPRSAEEYFNLKHSRARNAIEKCFGAIKGKWAILRSPSFFPVRTQGRIVMACCLLHNLVKKYMPESLVDDEDEDEIDEEDEDGTHNDAFEFITTITSSDHWTTFRNTLAQEMFNNWRARVMRN